MAVILSTFIIATTTPITGTQQGRASYYDPGVMARVIANRQTGCCGRYSLPIPLPAVDGYVARPWAAEIGTIVWARPLGYPRWERFLVTDCGGVADGGRDWMLRGNILGEFDYATIERWRERGDWRRVEMRWMDPKPEYSLLDAVQ